ncbi:MAG TPA: adenosylcobinamide-GDP ribazoletransferase [Polyangiales bacterium]
MFRPFTIALSFLTRLPVDAGEVQPRDFGPAVACFPLVGLLLGAASYALQLVITPRLGPALGAALIVTAVAFATGGLHLDGLSDLFDGLGGARGQRERALEIMRDSRIGAHGASALVLLLLTRVIALGQLLGDERAWVLVAAPTCARGVVVPLIAGFRYARPEGLGRMFHEQTRLRHAAIALLLTAAVLAPLGLPSVGPALCTAVAALLLALWVQRKLGGLTGDVYGAIIELAELVYLLAVIALSHAVG